MKIGGIKLNKLRFFFKNGFSHLFSFSFANGKLISRNGRTQVFYESNFKDLFYENWNRASPVIILPEQPSTVYSDTMSYMMKNCFQKEFQSSSREVQISLDGTIDIVAGNRTCDESQSSSVENGSIIGNSEVINLFFVQEIQFDTPFQIAGLGKIKWMFSTVWFNQNITSKEIDFYQVILSEAVNGSTWEVSNYRGSFNLLFYD